MEWKDLAGQDIKVGDVVVYATSAGRSAVLKLGVVKALSQTKEPNRWNRKTKEREVAPTIKCVTVDPWDAREDDDYWAAEALQKDGKLVTIGHLNRVVVVTNLPLYLKLFEEVTALSEKAKERQNAKRLARG